MNVPSTGLSTLIDRAIAAGRTRVDRIRAQIWVRTPLGFLGEVRTAHSVHEASPCIVAVTTYPARVGAVHLTLRSILKQSFAVDRTYLVLSSLEFPRGVVDLPRSLRKLLRKTAPRIQVLFTTDNQLSFKKLLPVLARHPRATILTADDDVIYTRDWALGLFSEHKKTPGVVLGTRGTMLRITGRSAVPYADWRPADIGLVSHNVFLTGRGGILYPPESLDPRVFDWEAASSLCVHADDVWFKAMSTLAGFEAMRIESGRELPANGATQREALWRRNQGLNQNDVAIKNVLDRYDLWSSFDQEPPGPAQVPPAHDD
jgi:hypothetical protein